MLQKTHEVKYNLTKKYVPTFKAKKPPKKNLNVMTEKALKNFMKNDPYRPSDIDLEF
jgi:hypothetical protein